MNSYFLKITILAFCAVGISQASIIEYSTSFTGTNGVSTLSSHLYVTEPSVFRTDNMFGSGDGYNRNGQPYPPDCIACESFALVDVIFAGFHAEGSIGLSCGIVAGSCYVSARQIWGWGPVTLSTGVYNVDISINYFCSAGPSCQSVTNFATLRLETISGSGHTNPEPATWALIVMPFGVLLWRSRYSKRHDRQRV